MEKPKTLRGLENLLRELKNDEADFRNKEVIKPQRNYLEQVRKEIEKL